MKLVVTKLLLVGIFGVTSLADGMADTHTKTSIAATRSTMEAENSILALQEKVLGIQHICELIPASSAQISQKFSQHLSNFSRLLSFKRNNGSVSNPQAAFHPDGSKILIKRPNNSMELWELSNRRLLHTFVFDTDVSAIAFHPEGTQILIAVGNRALLLDAQSYQPIHTFFHQGPVRSVAFSSDGNYILTGSRDTTAKLWDAVTFRLIMNIPHDDDVDSVAFSPDSSQFITTSRCQIFLRSMATGDLIKTMEDPASRGILCKAVFSPDGTEILVSTLTLGNSRAILFDLFSGDRVKDFCSVHPSTVGFSPDGRLILLAVDETNNSNFTLRICDAKTYEYLHELPLFGSYFVSFFNPSGSQLFVAYDSEDALWDVSAPLEADDFFEQLNINQNWLLQAFELALKDKPKGRLHCDLTNHEHQKWRETFNRFPSWLKRKLIRCIAYDKASSGASSSSSTSMS